MFGLDIRDNKNILGYACDLLNIDFIVMYLNEINPNARMSQYSLVENLCKCGTKEDLLKIFTIPWLSLGPLITNCYKYKSIRFFDRDKKNKYTILYRK